MTVRVVDEGFTLRFSELGLAIRVDGLNARKNAEMDAMIFELADSACLAVLAIVPVTLIEVWPNSCSVPMMPD